MWNLCRLLTPKTWQGSCIAMRWLDKPQDIRPGLRKVAAARPLHSSGPDRGSQWRPSHCLPAASFWPVYNICAVYAPRAPVNDAAPEASVDAHPAAQRKPARCAQCARCRCLHMEMSLCQVPGMLLQLPGPSIPACRVRLPLSLKGPQRTLASYVPCIRGRRSSLLLLVISHLDFARLRS